ncbi:SGNH/GDSL hydrolase family protein [Catenulispora sp. NF23]|uniref:SGNH/GDSL hydrolase family protein n=1 Tax=Catenulispora pinistramenti TaxID=2705254 RepID=UPI001BA7B01A|nr:SGNH/GDSL hydrolase family protein [Catenulispora pinistramenti]MBS2539153.1 SGNH/GDSL hydrolase family protein [Catenulispora pinistramenti]
MNVPSARARLRRPAVLLFALCLSSAGLMHGTARAATAISARTPTPTSSGLPATFDNAGISDDSAPSAANLDGGGYSFSAQALADDGWSPGAVFSLADGATVPVPQIAPGQSDNTVAAGQTFADPGSGGALDLVATSTDGTTGGTGAVTYADGTTQSFAMSVPDWWSGTVGIAAVAPYRNGGGGQQVHQVSLYLTTVPLVPGKTVASVTLPNATGGSGSAMHVFAAAFAPSAPVADLASAFDNVGISDDGDVTGANLDGQGNSFSQQDLIAAGWTPGAQVTAGATKLTLPQVAAGQPDNVVAAGQRISYSASGSALSFLATSTEGAASGSGTLTYTDGSTRNYTIGTPDWITGATDTMAVSLPHWNQASGQAATSAKLYVESVPLAAGKTLASLTLPTLASPPAGNELHVFALGVRAASGPWSGSWAAAADDGLVPGPWTDRTLRMVEHSSVGGSQVRVRLDNAFVGTPVSVGHVTVAVQSSTSVATGAPVTVTFHGNQATTIPGGGQAESDPVPFTVPADANLLVSVYFPGTVQLESVHSLGTQDMYSTADEAGDQTADISDYPVNNTFGFWTLLSGVDVVPSGPAVGTVVALGDSITDGVGSTYNGNDRWPNDLWRRLAASSYPHRGVIDEGISANRVVSDDFTGVNGSGNGGISAVSRLDRDVLSQSGVKTLIILEGVNDIKSGTSADSVIAGLKQIAAEAHAEGITVIGGTVTPFEGYSAWTSAYEAQRQLVNTFVRDSGGVFDGYVDFDAAVRDPANPAQLLAAYDSGDHLHPSAAGYQVMAGAVDLSKL